MQQVYDNSPCHTSITEVSGEETNYNHRPATYYPDHPLCNFWPFPRFTTEIKGDNFASKEKI
jgi:hypothetical protein